jgi:hypothetical protein
MSIFATQHKPSSRSLAVGAEGIAAAQFARCGFDVLVQAGHDKPMYDLAVTKSGNLLKISVKASDNGRWSLVHSYLRGVPEPKGKKADCQKAIDLWLDGQGARTVCCLVQFERVPLYELPRIYLAAPGEIARRMIEATDRLDDSTLHETYEWTSADGLSHTEFLPKAWLFSPERIEELLTRQSSDTVPRHLRPLVASANEAWARHSEASAKAARAVALTA